MDVTAQKLHSTELTTIQDKFFPVSWMRRQVKGPTHKQTSCDETTCCLFNPKPSRDCEPSQTWGVVVHDVTRCNVVFGRAGAACRCAGEKTKREVHQPIRASRAILIQELRLLHTMHRTNSSTSTARTMFYQL